ncbi:Protein detoxification 40 [Vitis vinifera]|uniref:Protein detoxification 40 n=1 Tax=Vitis vinifera TaxID=29760 RepID=A0A438EE58_VITVI|nr:Protein detoxification 40 [Vitis vinifera]
MDSQDDQLHTPILESCNVVHLQENTFESSSELEKVLSNLQLPWLRRLLKATWIGTEAPLPLAGTGDPCVLDQQRHVASPPESSPATSATLSSPPPPLAKAASNWPMASWYEMLGVYLQRATVVLTANWVPSHSDLRLCKAHLALTGESSAVASAAAVFVYGLIPQILRISSKLPNPKISTSTKDCGPKCFTGVEFVMVDHGRGPVCVHFDERPVQIYLDWVQPSGIFGAVGVLETVGSLCRDALLGDLVLSDTGFDCRTAQKP